MKKKVKDGAEVDMELLKEETDEEIEVLQKWEKVPESHISRNIQYKKKRKLEWMKIKSLCSNKLGQEKYLEVSHCGQLLTIQGEIITRKNHMNMYLLIFSKKIAVSLLPQKLQIGFFDTT